MGTDLKWGRILKFDGFRFCSIFGFVYRLNMGYAVLVL